MASHFLTPALFIGVMALGAGHARAETYTGEQLLARLDGRGTPYSTPGVQATAQTTFNASQTFVGFLRATEATQQAGLPSTVKTMLDDRGRPVALSWTSPITGFTADTNPYSYGPMHMNSLSLGGSLSLVTENDWFTTTGGALRIANLRIDADQATVYADLWGANGVGELSDVALWHIKAGQAAPSLAVNPFQILNDCPGGCFHDQTLLSHTYTGLTLVASAVNPMSRALGLTDSGERALARVEDFGTLTTVIAVPEPSTWLLMTLGLAGVSCAPRPARRLARQA